jgi:aldose 1-epimerase
MLRSFGTLEDGRGVDALTLGQADGLQVEVLTYGAILRRLTFPVGGARRDLILGFERLDQYERDRAYVGPVVGRFGNRIAGGRFSIDGHSHQVTPNENGNHLHGGALGVSKRLWRLVESDHATRARLALHSPDGEEGYPGNADITLELAVTASSLRIRFEARSDAPTPVNLTYHPYFNLGGTATAHWLRVPASRYLPVRAGLIPTGELASVEGTPFDFRVRRELAPPPLHTHPQLQLAGGYDHCWVLDENADCTCELSSPNRDLTLTLRGSGPGLQFYNGQFLGRSYPSIGSGLILEPQGLPDAPNHAGFPNSILRPGEIYRAEIEYLLKT